MQRRCVPHFSNIRRFFGGSVFGVAGGAIPGCRLTPSSMGRPLHRCDPGRRLPRRAARRGARLVERLDGGRRGRGFRAKLAGEPIPAGERTARVLAGYRRTASDRGRGQARLRRSEIAAVILGRHHDDSATRAELRVRIRASKTNPTGDREDYCLLVGVFAQGRRRAPDQDRAGDQRVIALTPPSKNRRPVNFARQRGDTRRHRASSPAARPRRAEAPVSKSEPSTQRRQTDRPSIRFPGCST